MDAKTLKALKGSIRKWEGILCGEIEDGGSDNCPLCQLFIENVCRGCPVYAKTKKMGCHWTPYDEWRRNLDPKKDKRIALRELRFLESLSPKGTR